MKKSYLLIFCLLILGSNSLFAQALPTEIIAKFSPKTNILSWQKTHLLEENAQIKFIELISQRSNLALLSYDASQIDLNQVKKMLRDDVLWIAPNHSDVNSRATPNDPLFSSQWGLTDIGADEFWDINTNGLTYSGDTIVVAVMESGTSINHPDLTPNFWHNNQEVPNDGIDNDNNGYVDDYLGWNAATQNDTHPYDAHGTKVTGVVGAKGDNTLGISGVNWNIKVMPISFVKNTFATYFRAFDYMIDQRKLYNETNGEKGALIVAVNESFGQDNGKPDENPNFMQWCEYMDALGDVGILTIAATSNSSTVNVDVDGDMPTTCPQEHLISVTNIDPTGIRYGGFGAEHIDLAAPGTMIPTTNGTNSFASFGGTSSAAPHVAGAVGLIYSYPCEKWSNYIKSNPKDAALQVKKWILANTTPKFSLKGMTVSEGSLNFKGIIADLDVFCKGNKLEPIGIHINPTITDGDLYYSYNLPKFGKFNISIFNILGQKIYSKDLESDVNTPQKGSFDVAFLSSGMYILMISQGDKYLAQKFIRE